MAGSFSSYFKYYPESLKHALWYRRVLGFAVLPEGLYKEDDDGEKKIKRKPLVKWAGFMERKPAVEEVKRMFEKFPFANICMVLGKPSGVVVIDVDSEKIPSFLREIKTWTVKTKRGYHFYFDCRGEDEVPTKTKILEDVDLKGDRSIITLPRSFYYKDLSFRYEWIFPPVRKDGKRNPLVHFSVVRDRLVACVGKNLTEESREAIRELYRGVKKGSRNTSLTRIAGSLFHDGLSFEEVVEVLLFVNEANEPPLSEKEVVSIAKSLWKKELRKRKVVQEMKEKLAEKFVEMSRNGGRKLAAELVELLRGIQKRKGIPEKDFYFILQRISFYELFKEVEKELGGESEGETETKTETKAEAKVEARTGAGEKL